MFKIIDDKETCKRSIYFLGIKLCKWTRSKLQLDRINKALTNVERCVEFLMKESSGGLMAKGSARNLQLIQINFLNAFDMFCKSRKLHYWVDFGTLLGAARNAKFIPWDDDVDVSMLRRDFEIILDLERKGEQLFGGYYFKY